MNYREPVELPLESDGTTLVVRRELAPDPATNSRYTVVKDCSGPDHHALVEAWTLVHGKVGQKYLLWTPADYALMTGRFW